MLKQVNLCLSATATLVAHLCISQLNDACGSRGAHGTALVRLHSSENHYISTFVPCQNSVEVFFVSLVVEIVRGAQLDCIGTRPVSILLRL